MFKDYFTIPTGFGNSKYHEFSFDAEKKGCVMAMLLSTSEEVSSSSLLKRTKDEEALNKNWITQLNDEKLRLPKQDLSTVPSKQHRSRMGYLARTILEKYYQGDEELCSAYFEDGTKGLGAHNGMSCT